MNNKNDKDYDDNEYHKNNTFKKMIQRTSTGTSTSTIIKKMMNFSHERNYIVLLSSLTHIVLSFNVSSSIK